MLNEDLEDLMTYPSLKVLRRMTESLFHVAFSLAAEKECVPLVSNLEKYEIVVCETNVKSAEALVESIRGVHEIPDDPKLCITPCPRRCWDIVRDEFISTRNWFFGEQFASPSVH